MDPLGIHGLSTCRLLDYIYHAERKQNETFDRTYVSQV